MEYMPLSFTSESHGDIAFGFFNIESDMLLLEKYFFYADVFCEWIKQIAANDMTGVPTISSRVHIIDDSGDIGDLMGAIHGIRLTGFIGELYKLFPFPSDPASFKQNPEGFLTKEIVNKKIKRFSEQTDLTITFPEENKIKIGPYLFDISVFHELIRYVWQGGYPRWKDEIRPEYVLDMKDDIIKSKNVILKGVFSSQTI